MRFEKSKCPVVWDCLSTGENITVEPNAIYNSEKGWLCACGEWITGSDLAHDVTLYGIRDSFIREKGDFADIYIPSASKTIHLRCLECGQVKPENQGRYCNAVTFMTEKGDGLVIGDWVCFECYNYVPPYSSKAPNIADQILNCSILYNPELNICTNCHYFRYCSDHYVIIKDDEVRRDIYLFQSP